jgi:hypothetical protein
MSLSHKDVSFQEEVPKDQRYNSTQLHQNVDGGARSVLQWVSYGVADYGCSVGFGLFFECHTIFIKVPSLYEFLGVVPGTTRVGRRNRYLNPRNNFSRKETSHGVSTKEESHDKWREDN